MPETRKHIPQARDDLDRALFAALGEPVRPFQPGAKASEADPEGEPGASEAEAQAPKPTTLGSFTFRSAPRPK